MNPEYQTLPPYSSVEEHLNDCLSWLDECLDFCAGRDDGDRRSAPSPIYSGQRLLARQEAVADGQLPITTLIHRLSMTDFESFLLLLALAPELDIKYEYIYSTLQGNPACLHPTLGLAKNLYSIFAPVTLSQLEAITDSGSPINRFCFEQTAACGDGDTLLHRNLVLKRTAVRYLLGFSGPSDGEYPNSELLPRHPVSDFICYPAQFSAIRRALESVAELDSSSKPGPLPKSSQLTESGSPANSASLPASPCLLIHLSGEDGIGRKCLLSQALCGTRFQIRSVDMRSLYHMEPDKLQQCLETLALEAVLWNRFLHLDCISPGSEDDAFRLRQATAYLSKSSAILFLSGQGDKLPLLLSSPVLHIPFSIPDAGIRGDLWKHLGSAYPFDSQTDLEAFGHQYRLTPGQIARILAEASSNTGNGSSVSIPPTALTAAISHSQTLSFHSLATRIGWTYTWDDLQLAPAACQLLHSACSRLKSKYLVEDQWGFGRKSSYGKGLSLLFYGPPGTGKTMAAQVIARESGLELYRVDLSQIFNKYIGETEKNIGKIFDEAKKADIILFFDEADSLFSKRTDVSNSNDRHSNAEISCLLQKMEEHDGVTILSTNLYQNFDTAFLRRITYTVHFDMPDVPTRLRLWQSMVPPAAPISPQVDFQRLSRQFELSGSSIKSILRGAAYLAAEEDTQIHSKHIIKSMKYEFLKIGKIISNEEFGEYSIYL